MCNIAAQLFLHYLVNSRNPLGNARGLSREYVRMVKTRRSFLAKRILAVKVREREKEKREKIHHIEVHKYIELYNWQIFDEFSFRRFFFENYSDVNVECVKKEREENVWNVHDDDRLALYDLRNV